MNAWAASARYRKCMSTVSYPCGCQAPSPPSARPGKTRREGVSGRDSVLAERRDHELEFFRTPSAGGCVKSTTPPLSLGGTQMIEWMGGCAADHEGSRPHTRPAARAAVMPAIPGRNESVGAFHRFPCPLKLTAV